ncbi:hypothetical protein BHC46_02045 [Snodgrassella alvi]|uniref:Uncharacterized protein n=1 Tax=Snodgrassella alvi TaxID=1196083 RepID=A0A2N9XM38_9NEIS|nr:hypothetical protein BGI31_06950 [Snodgrassella communis]PIT49393.1 hypothetical protein BHC46_02045 [Snodgrassella alvi]
MLYIIKYLNINILEQIRINRQLLNPVISISYFISVHRIVISSSRDDTRILVIYVLLVAYAVFIISVLTDYFHD